ncbi:hypothetical protein [Gellertiella hungarica]|uniref:Uncharacterized protein n=1 Tax=Gellertiella hungarica TaxID=1572859 RepID=A0A7W6NKT6_9HYPH|nr:hypothetical protein [Gellertiella hungarica]MBB4064627.1 hypothetical protein [Gellertiella hungarica]
MFAFDSAHEEWRPEPVRETGKPAASDWDERQVISRALGLIHAFAEMLVQDPLEIELRDEMELPIAKETMIQCFALILMAETRPEWRNAFYNSGLKLAYFWPDIGADRLLLPKGIFEDAMNIGEGDSQYQSLSMNADHIRRFSEAFSRVGPEHDRIAAIFDDAIAKLTGVLEL